MTFHGLRISGPLPPGHEERLFQILLVVVALDGLDHDGEEVVDRSRNAELLAVLGELAVEDLDLGLTVVNEHILGHGGIVVAHVVDEVLQVGVLKLHRVKGNALCRGDGAGFAHDTAEELHAVGILCNLEDLQTQQRADGVDGAVDDDLLPDVGTVVFVEFGTAAALGEDLGQVFSGLVGDGAVLQGTEVDQGALDLGGDAVCSSLPVTHRCP